MTIDQLAEYKSLAEKHGKKSGQLILELIEEVQRLRRLTLRKGTHPVEVEAPWPYHPHLGVPFHQVPEEYLVKWLEGRTRQGLSFDIQLGQIAERDLALYDLISRLNRKPETEIHGTPSN